MTFDLDLYLQDYLAVKLPILWIIFTCDPNTTQEGMMCHVPFSGQEVKGQGYTQMVNIFAVGAGGILVDHWSTISSLYKLNGFYSLFNPHTSVIPVCY